MDQAAKLDPMTEMALRSLHDIAMPPPVSWMPQTWGWAALAVILLLILMLAALRAIRRFRRNAYRREALLQLDRLKGDVAVSARHDPALRQLSELLKRTALAAWPRSRVAALAGAGWAQFMDDADGSGRDLARLLDDLEYRGDAALSSLSKDQAEAAFRSARQWVERHHVSA
jgi:hypothetical protein